MSGSWERARSTFFGRGYFNAQFTAAGPRGLPGHLCRNAPGEVIGGALILLSPRFVHYHLSASREDCFHMAPNNVLRDGVIRDFVGGTRSAIHFGGGLTGDPKDSLLAFKLNFSRQTLRFHIGTCVLDAGRYEAVCTEWLERTEPERRARFERFVLRYRY